MTEVEVKDDLNTWEGCLGSMQIHTILSKGIEYLWIVVPAGES
jgi:hypothetical protein